MDSLRFRIDGRLQIAQIGADELGKLAVFDDHARHHRVGIVLVGLRGELFEHLNIGGTSGLGLLSRGQSEFVEEDFLLTDNVDAALTSDLLPTLNASSEIVSENSTYK